MLHDFEAITLLSASSSLGDTFGGLGSQLGELGLQETQMAIGSLVLLRTRVFVLDFRYLFSDSHFNSFLFFNYKNY